MWTVVYIAKNKELAQKLKMVLQSHNILVTIRAINKDTTTGYEVLVPGAEVDEALGLIIDEA